MSSSHAEMGKIKPVLHSKKERASKVQMVLIDLAMRDIKEDSYTIPIPDKKLLSLN